MPRVNRWLCLLTLSVACGDNAAPVVEPVLDRSDNLVIVAHQDDDLLFMQPDLFGVVSAHESITTVYVTAGDAGGGLPYADARETGVKAAYGAVAGSMVWHCKPIELAAHAARLCRLEDRAVSLVFLGYPDGGVVGESPSSLLNLWQGTITEAVTISETPTTYDQQGLIETVAEAIAQTRPHTIRTLDMAGTHGDDHADHMMVGSLTQLALAETTSDADLIGYRGYNVNYEPANLDEATFGQVSLFMRAYSACLLSCGGVCGVTPCPTVDDPRYRDFLHRHYPIGTQDDRVTASLMSTGGCVHVEGDGDAVMASCDTAPDVTLEPAGLIRLGDECLQAADDGQLELGSCEPDPTRHFELDDEGHLWSGVAPDPSPNMLYDHSSCVYVSGGVVQVGTCGEARDWRWTLQR